MLFSSILTSFLLTIMENKNNYIPLLYIESKVKFKKTNLITFRHDHYF